MMTRRAQKIKLMIKERNASAPRRRASSVARGVNGNNRRMIISQSPGKLRNEGYLKKLKMKADRIAEQRKSQQQIK